jgi:hypothetical protein
LAFTGIATLANEIDPGRLHALNSSVLILSTAIPTFGFVDEEAGELPANRKRAFEFE